MQRLALAVIERAVLDLNDHDQVVADDALEFLGHPNAALQFWCEVADLRMSQIVDLYGGRLFNNCVSVVSIHRSTPGMTTAGGRSTNGQT